jgi:hypothetical protein
MSELSETAQELVVQLKASAGGTDRVVRSTERLALAVERDTRNRNRWFVGLAVGLVIIFASVAFVLFRQESAADRGITIRDCVVPGGDCYARVQQQRRADAERQTLLAITVATCGQTDPTHLSACVHRAIGAADTPSSGR